MLNKKLLVGMSALFFILSGCGGASVEPELDASKEKIKAPTQYTTDYDSFLRNIGNMYRVYYDATNAIPFQSKPITNDTGTGGLPVDVSKMVITAVSKIGKPIVYIPYDPNYLINELNTGGAINRVMPKYVISGAITEYDKGIMRKSDGGSFDFFVPFGASNGADGSASKDNSTTASRIVMDFFLIDYATQSMVSGVQSTKTITIYEQSKSKDMGFHIFGSGFGINGSVSRKQGIHAALRLLIELSVAEIISKEAGLPYWKLSKEIQVDEATIDKVYYDMDALDDATKIVLMKDYLQKYGFRIDNIEDPQLDAQTVAFYEVLRKDFDLGPLGDTYIKTKDLLTLHFNLPYKRNAQKYNNSMAKVIAIAPPKSIKKVQKNSLEHLFENIDKLQDITSSIYVGSIVDANDMYKTPFSENLENKIKAHIQEAQLVALAKKPISIKEKTRSFKKRKKVNASLKQQEVELVGYVENTENGVEVELQILSKDSQRLRVIKENFAVTQEEETPVVDNLNAMLTLAKSESEMKTDDIFFMTEKGDTHQVYYDGEKIEFSLGVREPMYAYIFDIDSKLHIETLFDSTVDTSSGNLQSDELYLIPSQDSGFEIIASAPFGTELIKLVVCSKQLQIPKITDTTRSFKKSTKTNSVTSGEFMNALRIQAKNLGVPLYEKTILVETRGE